MTKSMNREERSVVACSEEEAVTQPLSLESRSTQYSDLLERFDCPLSRSRTPQLGESGQWGARRRLDLRILLSRFPVIRCTPGVPELFAKVTAERERAGGRMTPDDAWIAATAIHHDIPLVTHDENFLNTNGLRIHSVNPEIIALRTAIEGRGPLEMDLHCRCGY